MEVQARTKEKPTPVKVAYPLLDTKSTADLVKNFGEEVVFNAAKSAVVISLQAFIRRHIDKGTATPEIQKAVSAWKPDVRSMVKMSAFEKATASVKSLSETERKALLAQLTAMK